MRDPRSSTPDQAEPSPFDSIDGVHALLASTGFDGATSTEREHVLRFDSPADWVRWSWSGAMRMYWERTPEDQRPAAEQRALGHLERMARDPEGLRLRMGVRYTTAAAG